MPGAIGLKSYDAVVVGAGVMGSAVALELSRRGSRVAIVERFPIGHARGSSHGPTRIFRLSYEDPDYVSLAAQSLGDWHRLERDSQTQLLDRVGGIDTGDGSAECAAAMHNVGVTFEEMTASDVKKTFGVLIRGSAIFQPDASVIAAAATVEAQIALAVRAGAELIDGPAEVVAHNGHHVRVAAGGDHLDADQLVLCAGPWMKPMAKVLGIDLDLVVTHEQVAYIAGVPEQVPIWIDRSHPVRYLIPQRFGAMAARVGLHHDGRPVDPDDGPFDPSPEIAAQAARWVSAGVVADVSIAGMESCLYTSTPDEDFIIERTGRVVLVSACSGHGFKFGPRMGRLVADLIESKPLKVPPRLAALWEDSQG